MIVEALLRLLIAEHKVNPIHGNVLVLGKQSIAIPLSKILEIFEENDCPINPNFDKNAIKIDHSTRYRAGSMDDKDFFQLFGDTTYFAMDVSGYENAEIIHDLNKPVPKELEEKFDFIVDGGTFDHLFDLKTAFANVVKMLKPGGRVFQWNAASNYANAGYVSFSADFFYDYYALNKFADCRTYFAESFNFGAQNWCVYEFTPPANDQVYSFFRASSFHNMVLVFAEKGKSSTSDRMPIQLQYRDENLRAEYRENVKKFHSRSQKLEIRAIPSMTAKMPLKYKLLYKLLKKPNQLAYRNLGWL